MDNTNGIRENFLSLNLFSLTFKKYFSGSLGGGGGAIAPPHESATGTTTIWHAVGYPPNVSTTMPHFHHTLLLFWESGHRRSMRDIKTVMWKWKLYKLKSVWEHVQRTTATSKPLLTASVANSARRHSATTDSVYHAWRSLSSTVHDKHGKQTALNFSLCNFGKTFNSTWLRCVKQRELLFNLSVDITMQTARDDHNKQHTVRLGHYWCCPLLAVQGLCNGRVSTCPSVPSTAATFQSISPPHCQSTVASGQRQCCDSRRINAGDTKRGIWQTGTC